MRRSLVFGLCVVLCSAAAANAYTLPVVMTVGNHSLGVRCDRIANVAPGFDEVDFYLTTGSVADAPQAWMNVIEGRWTAGNGGLFSVTTDTGGIHPWGTTNGQWKVFPNSTINFDSVWTGSTIWTNTAGGGGRGPQTSGSLYNFFSGSWYTSNSSYWLTYPQSWGASSWNSTCLAALFVTASTPSYGIAFDGRVAYTYGGGTVEDLHFFTTPEPGMLGLLAIGLIGAAGHRWRQRNQTEGGPRRVVRW